MKAHFLMLTLAAALFGWCVERSLAMTSEPETTPEQQFQQATERYEQAIALRDSDPSRSERLLREVINSYRSMIGPDGETTASLEFNLANAYMQSNELGRAILHYRRAQQLDPSLPGLPQNLSIARARVETSFDSGVTGTADFSRIALFWHYEWALSTRAWIAAGLFSLAWLCALIRLIASGVIPRWIIAALFLLSFMPAGSLLAEASKDSAQPGAVIADQVVARTGPGESAYQPAFREPITQGVELIITQIRADWAHVQLPDKRTAWVPTSSIEPI